LITALARQPGVVQTVVTGNVRPNAEVKLGALGLAEFFDFDVAGYGTDGVDRYRLVVRAGERAAGKYGPSMAILFVRSSSGILRAISKRLNLAAPTFSRWRQVCTVRMSRKRPAPTWCSPIWPTRPRC